MFLEDAGEKLCLWSSAFLILFTQLAKCDAGSSTPDFYSFSVRSIDGKVEQLEKYRGKITLVVNVASECGYTDSHYKALRQLKSSLGPDGKFEILAFPCNQFGAQEPGTNEEIFNFATTHYDVNFPIFSKIDVIGSNADPAFKNLIDQAGRAPDWNFWKYLVDETGKVVHQWPPRYSVEVIFDDVMQAVVKAGGGKVNNADEL